MVYYLSVLDGVRSMRSFIFSGKSVTKIPNLLDWKKLSRRVSYLMLLQWIGLWLWDWAETLLKFYSCSGNLQLYWLVDIGLISYCRSSSSCLRTGHIFEQYLCYVTRSGVLDPILFRYIFALQNWILINLKLMFPLIKKPFNEFKCQRKWLVHMWEEYIHFSWFNKTAVRLMRCWKTWKSVFRLSCLSL